MEQVEGLSKPCLTLWSDLRNQKDAMFENGGAIGSTKARDDQGDFVVQNIGNGFAMNITIDFRQSRRQSTNAIFTFGIFRTSAPAHQ